MCGIFGYYLKNFQKSRDLELINKFKTYLFARGPDSFHVMNKKSFVIGISRLSIVDIKHETQPFNLETINITIVFNGEIYNFRKLRDFLTSKGVKLKSFSEVEVIAHLYQIYSEDFIKFLDGMFSIAILDHQNECFTLFRDPYGIKPLYWTIAEGDFAFSSDLSSLIKCFGKNNLNNNAIQEYLFHGYCSSNTCIASDINKVPPSSFLKFYPNRVFTGKYESFANKKYIEDFDFNLDNIDSLLQRTVTDQIAEEVPMGIMLSGGIDSSLIAKYLSLAKKKPSIVNSYSVRFLDKKLSNDYLYAKELSSKLKFNHHTITLNSEDSISSLNLAANNLDEPIADTGIIGTDVICRKAKDDGVKVLLSGTGADELFAGYSRHFLPKILSSQFLSDIPLFLRFPLSKFISTINPSFSYRISDPISNYFLSVSGMPSKLIFDILNVPIRRWPFFSKYEKSFPENYSLYFDQNYYLPDSLLAYTDKISMSNSVEIRVPYLSRSLSPLLFSFLERVPKSKNTKPLLREISLRYFKNDFFVRSKEGFDASVYTWPDQLIKYLINYLLDYSSQLNQIGINLNPLIKSSSLFPDGYARNLIFSLFILTKWMVKQNFFYK